MFSSLLPRSLPRFSLGGRAAAPVEGVSLASVDIHDVETTSDKPGRRLKHLLKLNHATFSILYSRLRFHNHTPHILGSAYLFGASAEHLNDVYEDVVTRDSLDHWVDSPSEIALHDYRDFLGKKEYQRAFVDFFEDQVVLHGYDWKEVVRKFALERGPKRSANPDPMFHCLTAGLGHPLIHMGYAYELNSREVAMEAMGLAATCYDPRLATLLQAAAPSGTPPAPAPSAKDPDTSTTDLFELFARLHDDHRLDGVFAPHDDNKLERLLTEPALRDLLMSYLRSWRIAQPTADFHQSQRLAAATLISTAPSLGGHGYDFFLVHLLTTSHAVRILLPFMEAQHHLVLVREWLLITLAVYIVQGRPAIQTAPITQVDLQGRDWSYITQQALGGEHKFDAHFVKACRALREAAHTWGDADGYFLKAAVKFASEYSGWVFDSEE